MSSTVEMCRCRASLSSALKSRASLTYLETISTIMHQISQCLFLMVRKCINGFKQPDGDLRTVHHHQLCKAAERQGEPVNDWQAE